MRLNTHSYNACLKQLLPEAQYVAFLVDWFQESTERCREHCEANGVTCSVLQGAVGVSGSEWIDELPISGQATTALLALLVLYYYKSTNADVAGCLSHPRGRGT